MSLDRQRDAALVRVENRALTAATDLEREFAQLYEQYFEPLVRFARIEGLNADDAADVVQSTMHEIWQRWDTLRIDPPSRGYFFRAVANRVTSFRRGRGAVAATPYIALHPDDPRAEPDMRLEQREFLTVVGTIVDGLPERCRQAYLLVREADLSYAAAAEVMGITRDGVKGHLTRAFAILEAALVEAGYGLGALTPRIVAQARASLPAGAGDEAMESTAEDS